MEKQTSVEATPAAQPTLSRFFLGTFISFDSQDRQIASEGIPADQVVAGDHERNGKTKFQSAGDRSDIAFIFSTVRDVTAADLVSLDTLLAALGGDSMENCLKIFYASKRNRLPVSRLEIHHVYQKRLHIFTDRSTSLLRRKAALGLFAHYVPDALKSWKRMPKSQVEAEAYEFLYSSAFKFEEVWVGATVALVVTPTADHVPGPVRKPGSHESEMMNHRAAVEKFITRMSETCFRFGSFKAFNLETESKMESDYTTEELLTWNHEKWGELEFSPCGDHAGVASLFDRKKLVTADDLLALDQLLFELGGDCLEHFLKIRHVIRASGLELWNVSGAQVEAQNVHVFFGDNFPDLRHKAAGALFTLLHPAADDGIKFDPDGILDSPGFSVEEIRLKDGVALTITTC